MLRQSAQALSLNLLSGFSADCLHPSVQLLLRQPPEMKWNAIWGDDTPKLANRIAQVE